MTSPIGAVPFSDLALPQQWPHVAIVYGCVEPDARMLTLLLEAGCQGLVFTGTGAGQLSAGECRALEAWPGPWPLMLRANQNGFSARDVLAAVEFILVHSRITLDEERMVHEFIEYPDRQSRKRNLKMRH